MGIADFIYCTQVRPVRLYFPNAIAAQRHDKLPSDVNRCIVIHCTG